MDFSKAGILFLMFLAFLSALFLYPASVSPVMAPEVLNGQPEFQVLIDAGHGGFDSGKVGIDGTLEKDVNLKIAALLQKLLQNADVKVTMSRTSDQSLSSASDAHPKSADMKNRAALMNARDYDCIISIHQNSYPEEAIHGAQVFYYEPSGSGRTLAELIQRQLILRADPDNHRMEKSNSTYYLLKNVSAPTVIVECGFLSNRAESIKLVDDAYQHKLAWAIHLGVLQYLNGTSANSHISE